MATPNAKLCATVCGDGTRVGMEGCDDGGTVTVSGDGCSAGCATEGTMSRLQDLTKVLRGLQTATPELEAAALISEDGLLIASALPEEIEEGRVAGMSAVLLSLGTRAAAELGRGSPELVLIKGSHGYVVMVEVSGGALLIVLATETAKLGLIFLEVKRAAQGLGKLL